jgi:isopenicillin N synthase-like dioxygenase
MRTRLRRTPNEDLWTFVKPVPRVFTVFPGDILQFLTNGYLLSTPHKDAADN